MIMRVLKTIAYALVITGAIVWGLVGFFNYNIVSALFGDGTLFSRIIYSLVGISAIVMLATAEEGEECYCDCSETDHFL